MRQASVTLLSALILIAAQPAVAQVPDPEPGAGAAAPAAGAGDAAGVAAAPAKTVTYAVGTRLRGIFVPAWFIEAFTRHAHGLSSFSWGADFTRRKGSLDIVAGLDVGWYGNIPAANWTGNDDSGYAGDTYWTEFNKFVFTSLDVNFIWNHDLLPWLTFRAGGGIGIGFLSGDYYKSQSGPTCTAANLDSDHDACGPYYLGANNPPKQAEDLSSYRVLPVVSALLGFRFNLHRHFVATLDGGFHNAFYVGAGGQYVF
jgi:hypothetical protein